MRRSLLVLPLGLLLTACPLRGEADRVVTLYVSQLATPAEVAASGTTLHVTLTAESGGCVRYDHVDVERSLTVVTLVAKGIDSSSPDRVCTADIRYNPVELFVPGPFLDPLTVVALQPDGTTLKKVVAVK